MMDTRRWVLVETWLSLGLRLEWIDRWSADQIPSKDWIDDDRTRYIYDGFGVWKVRRPDSGYRPAPVPEPLSPELSVEALKHELAHWLISTEEERHHRNFKIDEKDTADNETRALYAEKVIDALSTASGRIAALALSGGK